MRIKIDPKKCSGCHLCEMVCSLSHLGIINTEKSAIHIHKDDLDTSLNTPVLCRQCKETKCLNGEKVMEVQERRKFIWNKKRAESCPFNALFVLGEEAFHCNLCGGNPRCVEACTPGAIQVIQIIGCECEKKKYFKQRRRR
jgi:anaerobic carbon-monoxide dehydrogenase iron sulfur subunit